MRKLPGCASLTVKQVTLARPCRAAQFRYQPLQALLNHRLRLWRSDRRSSRCTSNVAFTLAARGTKGFRWWRIGRAFSRLLASAGCEWPPARGPCQASQQPTCGKRPSPIRSTIKPPRGKRFGDGQNCLQLRRSARAVQPAQTPLLEWRAARPLPSQIG